MDGKYQNLSVAQASSLNKNDNKLNTNIDKIGEKCMFFQVRHAERSETTQILLNRKMNLDPCITEYGKHQAKDTANEIYKQILKYKELNELPTNAKVKIMCSPFLRCMQTAHCLAKDLNGKISIVDNTIFVEDAIMEWAKDYNNMLKEKSTTLVFDNISDSSMKQLLGNYKFERNTIFDYEKHQDLKRSIFENDTDIAKRYNQLCNGLIDESFQCKDEINIVVVHATFSEWMSKMIEGKLEKAEYCATCLVETEYVADQENNTKKEMRFQKKNQKAYKKEEEYGIKDVNKTYMQQVWNKLCQNAFCCD